MKQTATTRSHLVMSWLAEHPGMYRPADVAAGLDMPTHEAATTLRRLWEQGHIDRVRDATVNRSVYGLPRT